MATEKWKQDNVGKMRKYRTDWYERNKKSERAKAIVRSAQRRVEAKEWFLELKSKLKCSECGFKHPAALDFHHIDSSKKEFNIGSKRNHFSKAVVLKEIEKCIVLCANCHRILHSEKE